MKPGLAAAFGGGSIGAVGRSGAPSFGSQGGYQSTISMNFRGQDKKRGEPGVMGANPNMDIQDEYITNLQQQIHFMELELKILREKVTEDEKKSGIGSLYDDDKTSHQHIQLLKTKYAKMKEDFDRHQQELQKQSLKVKGQEFVLAAQIDIMKQQNQKLTGEQKGYKEDTDKKVYDLDRVLKDTQKARIDIEADLRRIENELDKALTDHYDHKMLQDGEANSEIELQLRHDLEVKLLKELLERKKVDLEKVNADVAKVADDFLKWKDLQDNIAEQEKLKEDTEAAKVKIQFLNIQVKLFEEAVTTLNEKRDELTADQMESQSKNEELKNQLKVQEETAAKRLQLKLNRDKSAEVKDLIANEEMIKAHNDELSTKLRQVKEDYDKLLSGKMEAEEILALKKKQLEEDTATVTDQDAELAILQKKIEEE